MLLSGFGFHLGFSVPNVNLPYLTTAWLFSPLRFNLLVHYLVHQQTTLQNTCISLQRANKYTPLKSIAVMNVLVPFKE